MSLEGVDLFHGGGLLSVKHTEQDIDFTIDAFRNSLGRMRAGGYLS
jgi:hypothetical protein